VTEPAPLLDVSGVACAFDGLRAVDGATLTVDERSITALIGPNGAGKTTLFNVLTGFCPCEEGRVRLASEEIANWAPHRIARRRMVRTFQLTKALNAMPVIDNMLLAAPDQPGERLVNVVLRGRAVRARERAARTQALELLERFHLTQHAEAYAGTLSGGQRKLLELARALMTRPRLLLLDEPLAGVNPTLGLELLEHMQQLRAQDGVTVLFIEHDMEAVMNHADRVVVMAEGRVILSGSPAEVAADERVIDAYLGGAKPGVPEHESAA
jgi:branched-chain amino acid transport system ATP-binding protein